MAPQGALPGEFEVPATGGVVLGAPEIAESPFEDVPARGAARDRR